ncbi:hypothetical protein [Sporosarcina sp. FSL K6-5500]|uniref:hypothetical protein n=1 Tax=Sporosarcina sp. FSL K6-5500 TaxID=2921558 RepID=UPI0030F8F109
MANANLGFFIEEGSGTNITIADDVVEKKSDSIGDVAGKVTVNGNLHDINAIKKFLVVGSNKDALAK